MSEAIKVQEVFGQFAVEIDGKIQMFATEAEALTAGSRAANEAEYVARADAYLESLGLLGDETKAKTAATKRNQIVDFLAFEGASSAGAAEVNF